MDLADTRLVWYFGEDTKVEIRAHVEALERFCFGYRHWVVRVAFMGEPALRSIQTWAFQDCGSLESIVIPTQVTVLGTGCFCRCSSLRSVSFVPGSNLNEIDHTAFMHCSKLESISLPSSLTLVGAQCFQDCCSLRSVSFRGNPQLTQIDISTFLNCRQIKAITIPSSVQTIGEYCFGECSQLASVTIPPNSKLARIEASAFYGCSAVRSFVVPSSVVFIGAFSFSGCGSLSGLEFVSPSRVRELLSLPLSRYGLTAIPDSVEILSFADEPAVGRGQGLDFGPESKLKAIRLGRHLSGPQRWFLRMSSRFLKWKREKPEIPIVGEIARWISLIRCRVDGKHS
jgi:hypothetical protein